MRRLTYRQVAVLAAIEPLGSPMLAHLRQELRALDVSVIYREIDALTRLGLVAEHGSPPRFAAVERDRDAQVPGRP